MTTDVTDWLVRVASAPWTITIAAVLCAFVVGRVIVRIARPVLGRIAGRTSAEWDDRLVELMASPLSMVLALQALRIGSRFVALDDRALTPLHGAIAVATTLAVVWTAFRAVDLIQNILERRSWAIDRPSSRSVLAIASRFAKVGVFMIGAIIALAQLGVSVASLITGLGIGGLAVALGAQKTLENLFGTLSIGVDQPMREGDLVKLYDFVGTVETIGLRSTRIRTLDRTIVTIPNGDLANQRIESYTARDRLRLATTIGLVYETTAQQMRAILADLEAVLKRHPQVWPDDITVRFKALGASSLDVEVQAWFLTAKFSEFAVIRQELLLEFMAVVERHGSAIAFPTQTVHVVEPPP